jgi:hypothetical protein
VEAEAGGYLPGKIRKKSVKSFNRAVGHLDVPAPQPIDDTA